MSLSNFDLISFDCYGTLIDWESGIIRALKPLLARVAKDNRDDQRVLETFARFEANQEAQTPEMRYPDLLAHVHRSMAEEWRVGEDAVQDAVFGASVGSWPAFPDSAEALHFLKRHYKLAILSNVDRESFAASNLRLGIEFDFVFTAEDIGSYKPSIRNFEYMIDRLAAEGIGRASILHTAQSLFHDHVPANQVGLASAWINRRRGKPGSGATPQPDPMPHVDFEFESMSDMVSACLNDCREVKSVSSH